MIRSSRMVPVLRGVRRARSVQVQRANLPTRSQRPLDQLPTMAGSLIGSGRIETVLPNTIDPQGKLPSLETIALQAVGHKPVPLSLLQDVVRALPRHSSSERKSRDLLLVLDLLSFMAKTYDRVEYITMLNHVWAWKSSFKINISHYNAYLRAMMRIGMEADMETCFDEMAKLGLAPNSITHLRFFENFCETGHVDRALEIFSKMARNEKTTEVFHALIKGYCKARNTAAARDILPQMEAHNIVPNSETYTVLACGLAECGGHADEVLETLEKGKLSSSQIMRVLRSTSHTKLMETLCGRISESSVSPEEAKKYCAELIHARKLPGASMLLDKLIRNKKDDLSFFSDQMIVSEYPAKQVIAFCRSIDCEKKRSEAIQAAAKSAVNSAPPLAALKYLSALAKEGLPIQEHLFCPLIRRAAGENEAFTIIQHMVDCNLQDFEEALSVLYVKIIDHWHQGPATALSRVEQLKLPGNVAKRALAHHFVKYKDFRECILHLDMLDVSIWEKFVPMIAEKTIVGSEIASLRLIERISEKAGNRRKDIQREYKLHLPKMTAQNVSQQLAKPTVLTYSQPPNTWLGGKKINSEEELFTLRMLCLGEDQDAVRDHLNSIDESALGLLSLHSLINFYQRNKNLDRSLHYFHRALKKPNVDMGDWQILGLVALMLEYRRYDDALSLVRSTKFRNNFRSAASKTAKVSAVVSACLENVGFAETMKLIRYLLPQIRPVENHAMLPVIDYTIEHQPKRIMEVFMELREISKVCVGLLQIYRHFITENDERSIQICHAAARENYDHGIADMFLAFAYIIERKIPKAKLYLKSAPKETKRLFPLKTWCEGMLRKGLITDLELTFKTFCECGINYEPLYLIMAEHYAREGNAAEAKRLWLTSQEHNVTLSNLTRLKIAQAFEAQGQTPPFVCDSSDHATRDLS